MVRSQENYQINTIFILNIDCNPRACAVPNCGKDFVAGTLPGECCERCIPWEYARTMGIQYRQEPQPVQDNRAPQPSYDSRNQYGYNQPQYQASRADVYIYGPDEGARVASGQSIYFDCEVIAPYNQYAQPRWSRGGNQVNTCIEYLKYFCT